ncbi:MAG TPA: hypothetical protein V6C52_14065 [Coleofasciculaceae cyanobacterium]|jgi:hypothetical protein
MTVIPNFILKRMYRAGSLRRLSDGVGFDIINNLGPGQISKINSITMNGQVYSPEQIVLLVNNEPIPAESITEDNPATFFLNQVITCEIRNAELEPGKYELKLDLVSKEAGKVTLTVQDQLAN